MDGEHDKTLGVPTMLQYSLIAFLLLVGLALFMIVLFSPLIKSVLKII